MKLSLASAHVSVTTAASMAAAVEDASLLQTDIGSDIASLASAVGDTSSLICRVYILILTHLLMYRNHCQVRIMQRQQ